MNNLQKIRLLCILGVVAFYYWLYFFCQKNVSDHNLIAISFLIHTLAFMHSLTFFKFVRIPFVCILSALNIIGFAVAPANVDFDVFQLGQFNPEVFFHINLGYVIFYLCHFLFLRVQINKKMNTHRAARNKKVDYNVLKRLGQLQNYTLFFYMMSKVVVLPINGLNEFLELLTIGSFLIGFFIGSNSFIKNVFSLLLVLSSVIQIVLGGLIYPVIFFAIFISALVFQYGVKNIYGKIFIISGILLIMVFTLMFNPVKMEYRQIDQTGKSLMERLDVIYTLILTNKNSFADTKEDKTTFWRLTYPMSALSMVYEKTPSKVPFWNGESYYNLLYKFIPRFLWHDKPTEEMGQLFGHRYEVLDKWNFTTSMNTPIISEAYMNFGWIGFYCMFILMAFILARVVISSNVKSEKSNGSLKELLHGLNSAIVLIFMIQWESNFSMVFGKLVILVILNFLIDLFSLRNSNSNVSSPYSRVDNTKD